MVGWLLVWLVVGLFGFVGRLADWFLVCWFDCLLWLVFSVNCFVRLADLGRWLAVLVVWLVHWLIVWLVWLIGWLVCLACFFFSLFLWSFGRLVGWSVGWLVCLLGSLFGRLVCWLVC